MTSTPENKLTASTGAIETSKPTLGIAPPFLFDGTPGRYRIESGEHVDVIDAGFAGLIVLLSCGEWKCVASDGTFAGGRITGRVE